MIQKFNFKLINENLLNLPFFVFRKFNINNFGIFSKFLFFLYAKFMILIIQLFNKNIFCFIMNIFFGNDGRIKYINELEMYLKLYNSELIYYPNKTRILGSMVDHDYELNNLLYSYSLENFNFNNDDLIIDCGANVGNLYSAIRKYHPNFQYIGFEPDTKVFECLKLNISIKKNVTLYKYSLSNKEEITNLYINSETGDSSLEFFDTNQFEEVQTKKLDDFNFKKIKLLKIDAEGHELEVLKGSVDTLKHIEFITVDMGAEKNDGNDNTVSSVVNFLLNNNFELVNFKEKRTTGLFKNLIYNK